MDPVSWVLDSLGARLGELLGVQLTKAPPGQVGCGFRVGAVGLGGWKNGLVIIDTSGARLHRRRSDLRLDPTSLDLSSGRRPRAGERLRLGSTDRVYSLRTADGRAGEIAVGSGGRAAILASLRQHGHAE